MGLIKAVLAQIVYAMSEKKYDTSHHHCCCHCITNMYFHNVYEFNITFMETQRHCDWCKKLHRLNIMEFVIMNKDAVAKYLLL